MIGYKIDKRFIFDTGLRLDKQILAKIKDSNMLIEKQTVGFNTPGSNIITVYQENTWPDVDEDYWQSFAQFIENLEIEKKYYLECDRIFDGETFIRFLKYSFGGQLDETPDDVVLNWYRDKMISFLPFWGNPDLLSTLDEKVKKMKELKKVEESLKASEKEQEWAKQEN